MLIPYPKFSEIGKQATEGVPCARLLWMALSALCSHPEYSTLTPEEVYQKVKEISNEVYK